MRSNCHWSLLQTVPKAGIGFDKFLLKESSLESQNLFKIKEHIILDVIDHPLILNVCV